MGCGGIISAKEGKMIMENRLKYWNGTSFEDKAPEAGEFETHLANTTTAHGVDTKADASVVSTHLADGVTFYSSEFNRDLTITGVQKLTGFPFVPEVIVVDALVNNSKKISFGKATESINYCIFSNPDTGHFSKSNSFTLRMEDTAANRTNGVVEIKGDKTIDVTWTHSGDGATGTVDFRVLAFKHGGGA